jgi:hypothetical protein
VSTNSKPLPPADPDNPETRLLRAIFGLCPDHDTCPPGAHEDQEGTVWNAEHGRYELPDDDPFEGRATWITPQEQEG